MTRSETAASVEKSEGHPRRQPPPKALLDAKLIERWSRVPPGRTIIIRDTQSRGFSARIGASGTVSYALQYLNQEGRQCLYTIALPDDPSDPRPFRREAERIKYEREKRPDYDPLYERRTEQDEAAKARRAAKTFADVCASWIERRSDKRSAASDRSLLEKYLIPRLGSQPISRLTADHVRALHAEITAAGYPYQANRALALVGALWNFAGDGVRPRRGSNKRIEGLQWLKPGLPNPAAGVERNEEERRERTLTPDEFARVFVGLGKAINTRPAHAIMLLALTASRRGEILKAEWSQFDLERGIWNRPASLMKAGKIARLPLSAETVKLLKVMRAKSDPAERFLFPGSDHGLTALRRFWDRLRLEAKIADVRMHDIRRTIASWAVSEGVPMLAVSKMLAHSSLAVTEGHYAHLQDCAGREAAETVAKLIEQHGKGGTI